MRLPEYDGWDATTIAGLVRAGELQPSELLDAAIERAEARNPALNAIVAKSYDRARRRVASGLPDGPLRGVPFLLKDLIEWEGAPLTYGSNLLRNHRADASHLWVQRLEAAGAVVFAQTNTPEMGLLPTTEPVLYGPTRNPWNAAYSTGGSSGGSAAAVAARIVPVAHANDGGGSIRVPAANCGLFGLKPSRGRNPGSPLDPPDGYAVEHCVSRSIRDSALLLDITRGPLPGSRWWAPEPERPYVDACARPPGPLRIAWSTTSHTGAPAHPDCRRAVELVVARCEALGHVVEEAAPDVDGEAYNEAFVVLWCAGAGVVFEAARRQLTRGRLRALAPLFRRQRVMEAMLRLGTLRTGLPPLEPFTVRLARMQADLTPAHTWLAWQELQRAARVVGAFFERYDLFLTPTLGAPPWRLGHLDQRASIARLREQLEGYVAYTQLANTAGLPAMSVPTWRNADGLPIGAHFLAPFGAEDRLFGLAAQLEQALDWAAEAPS